VAAQGRQKEKKKTDGVFGEAVSFNTSLEKIVLVQPEMEKQRSPLV
jgi:hypothetical protein